MKRKLFLALMFVVLGSMLFAAGTEEGAAGDVTLTYLTWYTQGEEDELLNRFMEENPGITIEVEAIDGAKYGEILRLRMTAGDLPDVITAKQNFVEMLLKEGWALDITDEPATALLDRAPAVRDSLTYQGKVYSVPHEASLGYSHVYYNKVIFRELGLPVPFAPASIDELESALETIAAAGVEPVLFGAKDHWVTGFFALRYFESAMYGALAEMNGGTPIEPNEAYYSGIAKPSDALRTAFETLKRWQDSGWISRNSLSMTWPESFAHFAAGNAAVFPQGFWVPGMDQTLQADPEVFEIGAFYMPQDSVDGNYYATGITDKMLMVNARSDNLDAARVLLNWLGSEENLATYLNSRKAGRLHSAGRRHRAAAGLRGVERIPHVARTRHAADRVSVRARRRAHQLWTVQPGGAGRSDGRRSSRRSRCVLRRAQRPDRRTRTIVGRPAFGRGRPSTVSPAGHPTPR